MLIKIIIGNIGYDDFSDGIRIYTTSTSKQVEYSINEGDFIKCEYLPYGSAKLNFESGANTLVIRDKNTQIVYSRDLIIRDGDVYIVAQNAVTGWNKGCLIYTLGNKDRIDYEYSMDGGNTYFDIYNIVNDTTFLDYNTKVNGYELFEDNIIIRKKNSGTNNEESFYETPEYKNENIIEEYIYENGKTTVNFKQENLIDSKTKYEYIIDGESKEGNLIELEKDSLITLKIDSEKEFVKLLGQKDIDVKVIEVKEPSINEQENGFEISQGEIINDELGDIYYSVNDGEYIKYADKVTLDPGTYIIKAYEVSKDKGIKSNNVEQEITIEEVKEEIKQDDSKIEDNKDIVNDSKTEDNKDKVNDSKIVEKEDKRENNKEEVKQEIVKTETPTIQETKDNSNNPTTSDNIVKVLIVVLGVILFNILLINNKKNKRKK